MTKGATASKGSYSICGMIRRRRFALAAEPGAVAPAWSLRRPRKAHLSGPSPGGMGGIGPPLSPQAVSATSWQPQ